jgi:Nitroreductase family
MTAAVDALEAIGSARAMRYLCPDPIPDEAVDRLLWAATRASSAHNSQPWDFVVSVGRPAQPFRPIVRKPVAEVVHRDRW